MSIVVMIVDDDRDDVEIFFDAVQELDTSIKFLSANNGLAGLDLIRSEEVKPDFVFIDMNMPKISGRQFIAEVRKIPELDHIKLIIYSTSKPNEKDILGADEFITKPTSQEELCSAIAKVISLEYHGGH
jgi:CheY-like chemotaxis protein